MEIKKILEEKEKLNNFRNDLIEKYDLKNLYVVLINNQLNIMNIVVNNKKQGCGTKAMNELIKYCDKNKYTLTLTPEKSKLEGTTSKARLIKFYKRFGFVENNGRNRDYEFSEDMYRLPNLKPKSKLKY